MTTDASGNPLLAQISEDGFADCAFGVVKWTETATHHHLQLRSSFEGEIVGMEVLVMKGIQAGFDAGMRLQKNHVYAQGVAFHRTGPESDRLISAVASLYGESVVRHRMVDVETFTCIALHNRSFDMCLDEVTLKIFGRDADPVDEDAYYESFFNLDLKNKRAYWREKDPDYREPLIRALAR